MGDQDDVDISIFKEQVETLSVGALELLSD